MSTATLSFFRVPFAWNILSSPSLSLSMCAGKDGRQEEKGMTQDEIAVWHEFEQTPGDSGGQKPGVLQSRESQRVGHNLVTEQQQPVVVRFLNRKQKG